MATTLKDKNYITDECYFTYRWATDSEYKSERIVYEPDGRFQNISDSEADILGALYENQGTPISTEGLGKILWGSSNFNGRDPKNIKSHISRLRTKMNLLEVNLGNCIKTANRIEKGDKYTWYILNVRTSPDISQRTEVISATYSNLIASGYNPLKIAESLIKNDESMYGKTAVKNGLISEEFTPENAGKAEQWSQFLAAWPDSFEFIINGKKEIVGNYSFLSLDDEQYRKFLDGEISESDFEPSKTRSLNDCDNNHIMFLLNLSVNDEYSTPKNNILLRQLFWTKIASYGHRDILFKKIVVNIFRPSHEAYYKSLGFQYIKKHPSGGKVYEIDLIPYPTALFEKLNASPQYIDINDALSGIYSTRYLQLNNASVLTEFQLRDLAALIHDTDKYISSCLFANKADASKILTALIKKNTDSMFKKENIFVAIMGRRVIGLILAHKGPLKFDRNELIKVFNETETPLPDGFDAVCSNYLESYNIGDKDTVHIINVCIKKEYRGNGLGREMLHQFIERHRDEKMELYVLEENTTATKLYEEFGFTEILRLNGFSRDNRPLPCLKMKR